MFKVGIVGCRGTGGTHVRSLSARERVEGNVLRNVKPNIVFFLKMPGKQE